MVRNVVVNGSPKPDRATNVSFGAALVAFVNALVSLLIVFGLDISAVQAAEIQTVVNAFVLLVVSGSHVYGQITAERERAPGANGVPE